MADSTPFWEIPSAAVPILAAHDMAPKTTIAVIIILIVIIILLIVGAIYLATRTKSTPSAVTQETCPVVNIPTGAEKAKYIDKYSGAPAVTIQWPPHTYFPFGYEAQITLTPTSTNTAPTTPITTTPTTTTPTTTPTTTIPTKPLSSTTLNPAPGLRPIPQNIVPPIPINIQRQQQSPQPQRPQSGVVVPK